MGHGYPVLIGRVERVPRYGRASVPREKTAGYLLDPEKSNGKWRLFKALGYERENAAELEHDLKAGLAENGGEESIKNGKGEKTYAVDMELGRTSKAQIRTIWQVDEEGADPRFITAYKAKKRRDA